MVGDFILFLRWGAMIRFFWRYDQLVIFRRHGVLNSIFLPSITLRDTQVKWWRSFLHLGGGGGLYSFFVLERFRCFRSTIAGHDELLFSNFD